MFEVRTSRLIPHISCRKFSFHIINLFPLNIHRNFSLLCFQFLGRKECVNMLSSSYEVLPLNIIPC